MATRTPVIIEGLDEDWEAKRTWDFDFFCQGEVGQAPVNVFKTKTYDGETWQTSMREYIENFATLKAEAAASGSDVPYLRSWEIGQDRPDLLQSFGSAYDYFD